MSFKIFNSKVNITINRPPQPPQLPQPPTDYNNILKNSISEWIIAILKTGANNNITPTKGSRFYFLTSSILLDSYNVLNGTSFDMFSQLPQLHIHIHPTQRDVWIELCAYNGLKLLLESYNYNIEHLDTVKSNHISLYPSIYKQMSKHTDNLSVWLQRVSEYIILRNSDGSNNANEPSSNYPNYPNYIEVSQPQDFSGFIDETKWTPLHITHNNKNINQSYLTPLWGDVQGVINSSIGDELKNNIINNFFPSSDLHSNEIMNVLNTSINLTVENKMSAEFWSGGPGTVTPPGLWILIATYFSRHHEINIISELTLYKRITAGLFQASILCWGIKRQMLQERPIQAIRRLVNKDVNNWSSNDTINTNIWMPYQELSFVTPPFPDFVSGHSTFSGVASKILINFFQSSEIPNGKITLSQNIMSIISPNFINKCDDECNISNILIYPQTSFIQTDISDVITMPPTGVCLIWKSLDEMAEDAGKSRVYGGIHYESSNQGGLALGRNLAKYFYNL